MSAYRILGMRGAHRTFDSRSGEFDVLMPAYAATIHKSQGSEYRAVIIPAL
jgi:exodeoxyribonuclease V alpha subunit